MPKSLRGAIACALLLLAVLWGGSPAIPAAASPSRCSSVGPCWTLSPSAGPVGTTVRFSGRLPPEYNKQADYYQHKHPLFGLTGPYPANAKYPNGCPSFSPNLTQLQFTTNFQTRRIHGSFVIGAVGYCGYQGMPDSEHGPQPTIAGHYQFAWSCIACLYGEFTITYPPRSLAFTGTDVAPLVVASVVLLVLGGAFTLVGAGRSQVVRHASHVE